MSEETTDTSPAMSCSSSFICCKGGSGRGLLLALSILFKDMQIRRFASRFLQTRFFTKQSSTQFHKFATTLSTKRVRCNFHCLKIEGSYEIQARTDDKSSVNSSARATTEQVSFHRMKKLQSSSHGQGMHGRLHERIFAVST